MKTKALVIMLVFAFSLNAQVNLVSISPGNGATNVSLSTTITVVLDTPIDTLKGFEFFINYFTNAVDITALWYSTDLKTVNIGVNLESDKNYYFFVNSVYGVGGAILSNPSFVYFSTTSSFMGNTVSGTIAVDQNSGVDLSKTIVFLSKTPIGNGEPELETGAISNEEGLFTIPYVKDGVYYPIAINDTDGDGELNPESGDAFVFLEPISVSGIYTGLDFEIKIQDPMAIDVAIQQANSFVQEEYNKPLLLKSVKARGVNPNGTSYRWEFIYISETIGEIIEVEISQFNKYADSWNDEWQYQNYIRMETIPLISDLLGVNAFMENAEQAGGISFREQVKSSNFELDKELILEDHRYSNWAYLNPDTTQHIMWLFSYKWYEEVSEDNWQFDSEFILFGNFETGSLVITDVKSNALDVPNHYSLGQNYPNPFNPNTIISYSVPGSEFVSITIFDILGNKIKTLINDQKTAGNYEVDFNASSYPTGTYFYQIKTNNYTNTKKMLLLK